MEEKILIQGKPINILPIVIGIIAVAVLVFLFVAMPMIQTAYSFYGAQLPSVMFSSASEVGISLVVVLAVCGLAALVYFWLGKIQITVSDKRVFGTAAFGKRVDLPLDSISAVGTGALKGIAVSTASGNISFLMIQNSDEIHRCVSSLLVQRQNKPAAPVVIQPPVVQQAAPQSNADELKKYKELLDMGAITQEEFDAKKKQLLGL